MLVFRCCFFAQFGDDAGFWIFGMLSLNTTNVGSSRDTSLPCATGMGNRVGQWDAQLFPCANL